MVAVLIDRVVKWTAANGALKVLSVLLAILLWVMVLGSRSVEITKEVPIEILTPGELAPANEIPERVSFKLVGPKAFLRSVMDRREDPIRINLASARPGVITYRFFPDNIRLPIGVKVASITPASVPIKLEAVKRKEVPVRLELRGTLPEGYQLKSSEIVPEMVRIRGAESRIDLVTELVSVPVDLSRVRSSGERELSFELQKLGVYLDGQAPKVLLDVEPVPANFKIKNVDIRVLSTYKADLEEKTITVLVRTTPDRLKALEKSQIYATLDLRGKPRGAFLEVPKVTAPEGVMAVRTLPEKVKGILK